MAFFVIILERTVNQNGCTVRVVPLKFLFFLGVTKFPTFKKNMKYHTISNARKVLSIMGVTEGTGWLLTNTGDGL